MKLLLDTSVLIDFLRKGKTTTLFFERFEGKKVDFFISTIVIYELYSGKSTKNASVRKIVEDFISDFKRIELTEKIARAGGELYRDTGKTLSVQDYIIAASALEIGATVVTLNTKHFKQIPGVSLYPF